MTTVAIAWISRILDFDAMVRVMADDGGIRDVLVVSE